MNKGYALNLGLNYLDVSKYRGWNGQLNCCLNDARAMNDIAKSLHFSDCTLLLNEEGTKRSVATLLNDYAEKLGSGDFLLLSFSGHGGRKKDIDGDELDGWDETWCLYDGVLIDDELFNLLRNFVAGVRIFVISDSCHSGSIIRDFFGKNKMSPFQRKQGYRSAEALFTAKNLSRQELAKTEEMTAHIRLFAGCREDQLSRERNGHGKFTKALLDVWNKGGFQGNYHEFFKQIVEKMTFSQLPQHALLDPVSFHFDRQSPFEV